MPWQQEGDFVPHWTNGIRLFPGIEDNGGFLIILLSIVMLLLMFRPIAREAKSPIWSMLVGAVLIIDFALHMATILVDHTRSGGVLGSPTIGIGLITVSCGSILLLAAAWFSHLRQLHQVISRSHPS